MIDVLSQPLSEVDPEIQAVLDGELTRQRNTLEMIASENFIPRAVLQCQGSVLTNKYVEDYPGNCYYGGCENVDVAENLAVERVRSLSGVEYANVQPHSGAQANAATLTALVKLDEEIMGLKLTHDGHLTHGMEINFSGRLYQVVAYGVREGTKLVDMDQVHGLALNKRPQAIITGWSAYPRHVDFAAFRSVADEVGAYLWTDMVHFAGLVAAGLHPSPVPYSDVVSTTTHKTSGGPRSGMILSRDVEALGKRINSAVFPGQQGGPLIHVVATKAVALKLTAGEEFRERMSRVLAGTRILAERLMEDDYKAAGIDLLAGGTDVHLVLVDLVKSVLGGQQAEDLLHAAGITVNRNAVPSDPRPPKVTSGLHVGIPALAARGLGDAEFHEVADIIAGVLVDAVTGGAHSVDVAKYQARMQALTEAFPLYTGLQQ